MVTLKQPKTLNEQIEILKSRGLIIEDEKSARDILAKINYYRLINAYSLDLYDNSENSASKEKYKKGVSLQQIYDIYQFDTKLRHIVFELIESFELTFRTCLAYYLAHKYCATAYLRPELYCNQDYFNDFLSDLNREKNVQQRSLIIKHHNEIYNGVLPIWAMVETVSFGTLSKLYKNLKPHIRKDIASVYRTNSRMLASWLNAFVSVRNICAHYGRLYNYNLLSRPVIPNTGPELNSYKIFSVIYLLFLNIKDIHLKSSALNQLSETISLHTFVILERIGAPPDWKEILQSTIPIQENTVAAANVIEKEPV